MGNSIYWDESRDGFYEVFYITVNHRKSGKAFWLRSTLLKTAAPDEQRFGGLWLAAFDANKDKPNLALHKYFPRSECEFSPGAMGLKVADSMLSDSSFKADFEAEGYRLSWDLNWQKHPENLFLVPDAIRKTPIPKADLCIPNVDVAVSGHITVDGERYDFDGDPGGQSHHWGRHYAHGWLWGHCNDFEGKPGTWLEMLSVDLFGVGKLRQPLTMLAAETESGRFELLSPLDLLHSRAEYADNRWLVSARKGKRRIEAEFTAPDENFVAFPYVSPHNEIYTCHNSCMCGLVLRIYEKSGTGWKKIEELSSSGAHAEFCTPQKTTPSSFRFGGLLGVGMLG